MEMKIPCQKSEPPPFISPFPWDFFYHPPPLSQYFTSIFDSPEIWKGKTQSHLQYFTTRYYTVKCGTYNVPDRSNQTKHTG